MDFLRLGKQYEPLPQRKRRRGNTSNDNSSINVSSSSTTTAPASTVQTIEVQTIEGDLLNLNIPQQNIYIVHQCNCLSKGAKGLAQHLFKKYPYANTYKTNSPLRKVGTCSFHSVQTNFTVVNLYGQYGTGSKWNKKKSTVKDDRQARVEFFTNGLLDLESKLQQQKNDVPITVAFPHGIGCNLAGGDWKVYSELINTFNTRNVHVTVLIVRLANNKMKNFNNATGTKGKFEQTTKNSNNNTNTNTNNNNKKTNKKSQRKINTLFQKTQPAASSSSSSTTGEVKTETIIIDGSYKEGGGQILRLALALSILHPTNFQMINIRSNRSTKGLRSQHVGCINLVGIQFGKGATTEQIKVGTNQFTLQYPEPPTTSTTSTPSNNNFEINTGTAGSLTLLLQACFPVMLSNALVKGETSTVTLIGGTDVPFSPPMDHFQHVLLPLLIQHMVPKHIEINLNVEKRGYFPKGGGKVVLTVKPVTTDKKTDKSNKSSSSTSSSTTTVSKSLRPIQLKVVGKIIAINVYLRSNGISASTIQSTIKVVKSMLQPLNHRIVFETSINGNEHSNRTLSIQIVITTDTGVKLSSDGIATFKKFKKNENPNLLEEKINRTVTEACNEMKQLISQSVAVDEHTLDQLLIFMAMAAGQGNKSQIVAAVPKLSKHYETAVGVIRLMTKNQIKYSSKTIGGNVDTVLIECE